MEQLQKVFNYDGVQVRTILRNGEPWFVAKDVCDVLGISNGRDAVSRLDDDEKDGVGITDAIGREQQVTIINEAGLYSLILTSRKPEARQFKRWITHEVLPSIRKHGLYAKNELLNNPDLLIEVATKLKEEQEARFFAESQLEEQRPLVSFAETCLGSKDSILVRELAKIASKDGLIVGEKHLYKRLREWKLIQKHGTEPTQTAIDRGFFEVIQRSVDTPYRKRLTKTSKVTPKGQVYIIERLRQEKL